MQELKITDLPITCWQNRFRKRIKFQKMNSEIFVRKLREHFKSHYWKKEPVDWAEDKFPPIHFLLQQRAEKGSMKYLIT
jgi:hypothetical protein